MPHPRAHHLLLFLWLILVVYTIPVHYSFYTSDPAGYTILCQALSTITTHQQDNLAFPWYLPHQCHYNYHWLITITNTAVLWLKLDRNQPDQSLLLAWLTDIGDKIGLLQLFNGRQPSPRTPSNFHCNQIHYINQTLNSTFEENPSFLLPRHHYLFYSHALQQWLSLSPMMKLTPSQHKVTSITSPHCTLGQRLCHSYDHLNCWLCSIEEARHMLSHHIQHMQEASRTAFPSRL